MRATIAILLAGCAPLLAACGGGRPAAARTTAPTATGTGRCDRSSAACAR